MLSDTLKQILLKLASSFQLQSHENSEFLARTTHLAILPQNQLSKMGFLGNLKWVSLSLCASVSSSVKWVQPPPGVSLEEPGSQLM